MLTEAREIERETRLLSNFDIGNITIAMGFFAADISGSRAIAEMVRLHPNLHCQISVEDWRDVEVMVLDRLTDIGLAGTGHIKNNTQLRVLPVAEHEFVYFCRSGHPLLELENLSKSDLDDYPVVTVRVPPQMAAVFPGKSYLDRNGGDLTPSINTGDPVAARVIVAGSNAFSVAAPTQIEPWLLSGKFKVLDFREPWMKIDYGFIYRRDRMLAPAAEAFMQHVREIETEIAQHNQFLIEKLFHGTDRSRKD